MSDPDAPPSMPFHIPDGADPDAVESLIRANPKLNALVQERKALEQKIQSASGQARQKFAPAAQDARYQVDSDAERSSAARKWSDKREALRLRKLAENKPEVKVPKRQAANPERLRSTKRAVEDFVPQAERFAPNADDFAKRVKSASAPDWATQRDRVRENIRRQDPQEDVKRAARALAAAETMFPSDAEFDYNQTGILKPRTAPSLDVLNRPTTRPAVLKKPVPKPALQGEPKRLVKDITKRAVTKRIKSDVGKKREQRTDDTMAFYKKRDDATSTRPKTPKDMINDRLDSLRDKALARKKALEDSDPPLNRKSEKIDRFRDRWF